MNIFIDDIRPYYLDANVSKMLANSDDLASEPCETRTPDTLIKSQRVGYSDDARFKS